MKKNYDIVDLSKLILSFLVVMIHSSFLKGHIYPLARLAVPTFFIFSGYFAFRKINSQPNHDAQKTAARKIILRYLKLYAFWFVVFLPFTLYLQICIFKDYEKGFIFGILELIRSFFLGNTFPVSWYIMATVISIILVFKLSHRLSNGKLLCITIPFYLFATICSEFEIAIKSSAFGEAYKSFTSWYGLPYLNFSIGLLYIVIGKIIAETDFERKPTKFYGCGFIASLLGLFIEYFWLSHNPWFNYSCDGLLMLLPTATFLSLMLLTIDIKIDHAPQLRAISTIIYCSHFFVFKIVNKLIVLAGIPDDLNILVFLVTASATYLTALIMLRLEKIEKYKIFSLLKYAH